MRNCNCETDIVGTIRDHMSYPYDNFSKSESDARYALKEDTIQHFETIRQLIDDLVAATNGKAEQVSLDTLYTVVDHKATKEEFSAVLAALNNKAEQVSLDTLYTVVDRKATKEELSAVLAALNNKAEQSTVTELTKLINGKAESTDVLNLSAQVNEKVGRTEFAAALANTITRRDIRLLFEE